MHDAASLVTALRETVPAGRSRIDDGDALKLRELTKRLIAARPDAYREFERFQGVRDRGIELPFDELSGWLGGRKVLVTGGTGCIGSLLVEQLAALAPGRLVSVTRGDTLPARTPPGAEYRNADIRDRAGFEALVAEIEPDVIFHVAAQRSPARAEEEVLRTVGTNVIGTRNVLEAAIDHGVPDVVCASTGKALRPYSPDVYAASKRAAEWLMSRAAANSDTRITTTRFTHVVDNSIIADRLALWCKEGIIRLHSPEINFYVQSARESVQLLLAAGLGPHPGRVRVHTLRDLGWPVNLLDLALGMIVETKSDSPIYLAGYERGYEETPFPGLYDPRTAGDVSPLINAFEAIDACPARCPEIDAFDLPVPRGDAGALARFAELDALCRDPRAGSRAVREALDALSWELLDAALCGLPAAQLARTIRLSATAEDALEPAHRRILQALRRAADAADG
jgi:nucleoside-diphosphate-sugar epimerase